MVRDPVFPSTPSHVGLDSVSPFHGVDSACLFRSWARPQDCRKRCVRLELDRGYRRSHDRRSDDRDSRRVRRPAIPDRERKHNPRRSVLPLGRMLVRGRGGMAGSGPRVEAGPTPGHRSKMQKCHSIEEVARVLEYLSAGIGNWVSHRLYALVATVAYTGLRRDEALTLMVIDVSLVWGVLKRIGPPAAQDRSEPGDLPIPPELQRISPGMAAQVWLRVGLSWCRGASRPWTGGACGERAGDRVRQAGQEVGVTGFTLQSLRHTWATHARRRWGLSDIEVATVLRHSSPATQAWYVHDDPNRSAIVRSVSKVSYQQK